MKRLIWVFLSALCLTTISTQMLGAAPVPEDRLQPKTDITLKSMLMGDLVARGHLPTLDIWFPGSGDYELADGNYLHLEYDHSELVRPQDSTLTVLLNGSPITSTFLTPENAKRTTWKIDLPKDKLKRDLNHIQLKYYMRIRDDDCVNQENPALWSNIFDVTHIHYEYVYPLKFLGLPPPDLGLLPKPFIRSTIPEGLIAFVLPNEVSTQDFSAAASVAARFGQMAAGKELKTTLHFANQFDDQLKVGRDVVVIGKPGAHPLLDELQPILPIKFQQVDGGFGYIDPSGNPIDPESGVIQEVISPWDERCSVLVLSGGSDEGVQRAVRTIASRLGTKSLQGPYAIITTVDEELRKGEEADEKSSQMVISLDELGFEDGLYAKGIGVHPISFNMEAPPIDPQSGAYFDMHLTYSPLLDPVLSSVTVAINGVGIRTIALDREGAQEIRHRVVLPPNSLLPGLNSITITFGHHLRGSDWYCMPLAEERAWAHLHADSAFILPVGPEPSNLDLAYYPFPFVRNGTPMGTFLVIPDEPSLLQDSLQVAVALGKQCVGNTTEMLAGTEAQLTDEIRRNNHLIVYGAPPGSPIINQLGPDLPLSLEEDTERSLQKSQSVLLGIKDAADLGIIELIPSPWNVEEKALLLVSGTNSQTAKRSPLVLGGRLPSGNVALVATDDDGKPKAVGMKLIDQIERPVAQTEAQRQQRFYLIATIPAALLAIGMLGLMVVRSVR